MQSGFADQAQTHEQSQWTKSNEPHDEMKSKRWDAGGTHPGHGADVEHLRRDADPVARGAHTAEAHAAQHATPYRALNSPFLKKKRNPVTAGALNLAYCEVRRANGA